MSSIIVIIVPELLNISNDNCSILLKTLIYFFTDTFEENRTNASKCFLVLVNNKAEFNHLDCLERIAQEKSNSSNPHDCSVAYTVIQTLLGIVQCGLSPATICQDLLDRLETNLNSITNNIDLIRAAMTSPFYSPLFCIRQLLAEYFDE